VITQALNFASGRTYSIRRFRSTPLWFKIMAISFAVTGFYTRFFSIIHQEAWASKKVMGSWQQQELYPGLDDAMLIGWASEILN